MSITYFPTTFYHQCSELSIFSIFQEPEKNAFRCIKIYNVYIVYKRVYMIPINGFISRIIQVCNAYYASYGDHVLIVHAWTMFKTVMQTMLCVFNHAGVGPTSLDIHLSCLSLHIRLFSKPKAVSLDPILIYKCQLKVHGPL